MRINKITAVLGVSVSLFAGVLLADSQVTREDTKFHQPDARFAGGTPGGDKPQAPARFAGGTPGGDKPQAPARLAGGTPGGDKPQVSIRVA